jgi:tellurite resistance-related uncharacterized protein
MMASLEWAGKAQASMVNTMLTSFLRQTLFQKRNFPSVLTEKRETRTLTSVRLTPLKSRLAILQLTYLC